MKYRLVFLTLLLFLASCRKENLEPLSPNLVEGFVLSRIQSQADFSARDSGGELLFKDSLWLLGGFTPERSNEVWNSADGIHWIQKPDALWSPRNLMGVVEFQGKIWVMGGYASGTGATNDIYSSTDGFNWVQEQASASWSPRAAFGLLKLNNKLLLFGGFDTNLTHLNDVWESTDGVNWTNVAANAPWSARAMFSSVVFNNEIYLIGGGIYNTDYVYNVEHNLNDVWKTADGVNWISLTPNAAFSPRRFHNAFVLNNRLFLGSGFCLDKRIFPDSIQGIAKASLTSEELAFYDQNRGRYYGNLNDIWQSSNGVNWNRVSLNDTFPIRHEASVIVKNEEAYWIGGFGVDLYNDVWKFKRILK